MLRFLFEELVMLLRERAWAYIEATRLINHEITDHLIACAEATGDGTGREVIVGLVIDALLRFCGEVVKP